MERWVRQGAAGSHLPALSHSASVTGLFRMRHPGMVTVIGYLRSRQQQAPCAAQVLEEMLGEAYDVRDCGLNALSAVQMGHGNVKHSSYWVSAAVVLWLARYHRCCALATNQAIA